MSEIEQAKYIAQLNPMELRVMQIAKIQLQTSFSLVKSIGFINWQKKQKALALLEQTESIIIVEPEVPALTILVEPEVPIEVMVQAPEPVLEKTIIKKRLKIVPAKAKL
jgi:hypothetical protein